MSGENTLRREELEDMAPLVKVTAKMGSVARRLRSHSCVDTRPNGATATTRLSVFARLPASCPYVGSFHYAPSAGNRAYSFFEDKIVPHRESLRLHKIKTNPLTGNFHSRPGVYSRLHGLQNFREGLVSLEEGATMDAIVASIRSSLTSPAPPAAATETVKAAAATEARPQKDAAVKDNERSAFGTWPAARPSLPAELDTEGRPKLGHHSQSHKGFRTPLSASDAMSKLAALKEANKAPDGESGGTPYSKFWDEVDTERGRFGTSLDDNAVPTSSQQSVSAGSKSAALGEHMRAEAVAAGLRGVGKGGVHWGKHHHHHQQHHQLLQRSDEEAGSRKEHSAEAAERLRQQYLLSARPNAAAAAQRARRIQVSIASRTSVLGAAGGNMYIHSRGNPYGRGSAYVRGYRGVGDRNAHGRVGGMDVPMVAHRSVPDAWVAAAAAAAEQSGAGNGGMRRTQSGSHGWESHTVKAQQKTAEYMQGREDLAPDMRPDIVLDNELSLAYDVDVSDAGMLGAGAYGTVIAAVHRSTGRQVAIKTMLKKYLLSDAEKASVEREIEIHKRLVNNHVIRLYEIYQSSEQIHLVVERAPCGTLEEFLYVRGRMTELDAKRVVRQLLDGLAYLHKSGVVHCDLKPANILFTDIDQGNTARDTSLPVAPRAQVAAPASLSGLVVKICDFGHARKVPDCRYYKFTRDINKIPFHMFKHTGTEGFVAPEVLRSEPYGKAADMWSTGCMLNQMLTGRMPWIPSRACLQRPLSTSGPCWKNISEPAKALVGELLTADQHFRADVEQATHHPWFEGIHHCARMPTSAPGGKASPLSPPVRGKIASIPSILLPAKSPTPSRGEGVLSGDAAAGGSVDSGAGSSSSSLATEEGVEQGLASETVLSSDDFVEETSPAEAGVSPSLSLTVKSKWRSHIPSAES